VPYSVVLSLSLRLFLKVEAAHLGEAFATRKPPLENGDPYTERAFYERTRNRSIRFFRSNSQV
jgi:hypothetical protein